MRLFTLFVAAILLMSSHAFALDIKTRILRDIEQQVSNLGPLGAYELEIIDQRGNVTLKGFVPSPEISSKIERAAMNVKGVSTVHNELQIKSQPQQVLPKRAATQMEAPNDMQLLRSVKQSLAQQSDIDLAGLGVDVRNGVVYFSGSLNNHRTIDRILSHTLMVNGVRDVESNLKIQGREYR